MTFSESIKSCFTKYATFAGRASRSEFWRWVVFAALVSTAVSLVSVILSQLFLLAIFLPSLAVSSRRLHDTDRSSWFMLLWLIPIFGWIVVLIWAIEHSSYSNRFGPPA